MNINPCPAFRIRPEDDLFLQRYTWSRKVSLKDVVSLLWAFITRKSVDGRALYTVTGNPNPEP